MNDVLNSRDGINSKKEPFLYFGRRSLPVPLDGNYWHKIRAIVPRTMRHFIIMLQTRGICCDLRLGCKGFSSQGKVSSIGYGYPKLQTVILTRPTLAPSQTTVLLQYPQTTSVNWVPLLKISIGKFNLPTEHPEISSQVR